MIKDDMIKVFTNEVWGLERKGKEDLLNYLDETDFYNAPASTSKDKHLAEDGGLLQHSLNVLEVARDLNLTLGNPVTDESIVICALFHDIGKHYSFDNHYYTENILASGKRSVPKPYEINKEIGSIPHEILSLQILGKYIELTKDEYFAILHHNGMYGDLKYKLQGKETKLQMILHWADMWASRVIEQEK